MKPAYCVVLIVFLLSCCTLAQTASSQPVLFDDGWRFHRGGAEGAEKEIFDDKDWRLLDLPHDWSIENLPDTASPFSPAAVSGVSGGFTTGGTGWYRKTFTLPSSAAGKYYIQFDGVYMNATVWLNGRLLGHHPYGYTSFWYDITGYLKEGANVIAVSVKNEGRNSRWYSGSGIYRHVWLRKAAPTHIAQWGSFITTPEVNKHFAKAVVQTQLIRGKEAGADLSIVTTIRNRQNVIVATDTKKITSPDTAINAEQALTIRQPQRWSVDAPYLYKAVTEVWMAGRLMDRRETTFGIRTIQFDAANGFRLNGKKLELKGGCVHHDNGPLGAKAYDRAEERKVALLKESGYNAVRTSHNPPSPAFLDACDRLGMLVIDEAFDMWADKKNKDDYHLYFNDWWQRDLESMLRRDRNHPSIIMWSTGNEIPNRDKPEVAAVSLMLSNYIHSLDTTRPVTCGVNGIEANKDPILATLDVSGYNYARDKYVSENERVRTRVVYASESFAIEAYEYWKDVERYPWVIGDFVWTAWDYIGEASIGWLGYPQNKNFYPWNLAYCGDIDICGWKRPQSYYRDALWKKDQLSLFVKAPVPSFDRTNPKPEVWSRWNWPDVVADWNWPGLEGKPVEVVAYSNLDEVELFLNNRSLGRKKNDTALHYTLSWSVPYQKGSLKAVGYKGGKKVKETMLQTAEATAHVQLTADRKVIKGGIQDLSYVTVELKDKAGRLNPKAMDIIHFEINGPGEIVGLGNANPESTESYTGNTRKAWRGKCLVIIKSARGKGVITLKAAADGLPPAMVHISSN